MRAVSPASSPFSRKYLEAGSYSRGPRWRNHGAAAPVGCAIVQRPGEQVPAAIMPRICEKSCLEVSIWHADIFLGQRRTCYVALARGYRFRASCVWFEPRPGAVIDGSSSSSTRMQYVVVAETGRQAESANCQVGRLIRQARSAVLYDRTSTYRVSACCRRTA